MEKHLGGDKMRDKVARGIGRDTGTDCAAVIAFDNEPRISQSFISKNAKTPYPLLSELAF